MLGAPSVFAIGDCTSSSYAPTAQVASQQGAYLARVLKHIARKDALQKRLEELDAAKVTGADWQEDEKRNVAERLEKQIGKIKLRAFRYSHQGSLA